MFRGKPFCVGKRRITPTIHSQFTPSLPQLYQSRHPSPPTPLSYSHSHIHPHTTSTLTLTPRAGASSLARASPRGASRVGRCSKRTPRLPPLTWPP